MYLLTAVDSTMEKQHENMIIMGTIFSKEKERTFGIFFNNFFIDNNN